MKEHILEEKDNVVCNYFNADQLIKGYNYLIEIIDLDNPSNKKSQ